MAKRLFGYALIGAGAFAVTAGFYVEGDGLFPGFLLTAGLIVALFGIHLSGPLQ